jgi:hypothetical protein
MKDGRIQGACTPKSRELYGMGMRRGLAVVIAASTGFYFNSACLTFSLETDCYRFISRSAREVKRRPPRRTLFCFIDGNP